MSRLLGWGDVFVLGRVNITKISLLILIILSFLMVMIKTQNLLDVVLFIGEFLFVLRECTYLYMNRIVSLK